MLSIIGAVLIVMGLYIVLWGKSKEMKKVTHLESSEITPESEEVEVVVTSTTVDHGKSDDCSNNSPTSSSESDTVAKEHNNSSKREYEVQDIENNGTEDIGSGEVPKA